MKSINPKLIVVLVLVVLFAIYIQVSNPHKKYSTQGFWLSATVEDVHTIPEKAISKGNKNGGVLMWAATVVQDPKILTALVRRGADVNEGDVIFSGTPLSAAAAYNSNPAIIDELIGLGAEINKVVGSNDKTPLIIAAELNPNPKIIEKLIFHGADVGYRDLTGKNALEQAIEFKNSNVLDVLKKHTR